MMEFLRTTLSHILNRAFSVCTLWGRTNYIKKRLTKCGLIIAAPFIVTTGLILLPLASFGPQAGFFLRPAKSFLRSLTTLKEWWSWANEHCSWKADDFEHLEGEGGSTLLFDADDEVDHLPAGVSKDDIQYLTELPNWKMPKDMELLPVLEKIDSFSDETIQHYVGPTSISATDLKSRLKVYIALTLWEGILWDTPKPKGTGVFSVDLGRLEASTLPRSVGCGKELRNYMRTLYYISWDKCTRCSSSIGHAGLRPVRNMEEIIGGLKPTNEMLVRARFGDLAMSITRDPHGAGSSHRYHSITQGDIDIIATLLR